MDPAIQRIAPENPVRPPAARRKPYEEGRSRFELPGRAADEHEQREEPEERQPADRAVGHKEPGESGARVDVTG